MEHHEQGDQAIGQGGETEPTVGQNQQGDSRQGQQILEQPISAIERFYRQPDPEYPVREQQPLLQTIASRLRPARV